MPSTMVRKMEALRQEARVALEATPEFREFMAIDTAIAALGGETSGSSPLSTPLAAQSDRKFSAGNSERDNTRRISQGDAAAAVLEERGPVTAADLLRFVPEKGAIVGGEKPLINLTSTLSKDARFRSIRHDGSYLWWFENRSLPANWNTGAGLDLGEEPAPVSAPFSEKGGDGNAPATS